MTTDDTMLRPVEAIRALKPGQSVRIGRIVVYRFYYNDGPLFADITGKFVVYMPEKRIGESRFLWHDGKWHATARAIDRLNEGEGYFDDAETVIDHLWVALATLGEI